MKISRLFGIFTLAVSMLLLVGCSSPVAISEVTPLPANVQVVHVGETNTVVNEISQVKVFNQCQSDSVFRTVTRFSQSSGEEVQRELVLKGSVGGEVGVSELVKLELCEFWNYGYR